jgi:Arc/MetJ-type ribon-helix-helix transcriptional regulator
MQISLAIPEPMLKAAQRKARAEGYRSVQEYILQALRDKWFIDNLPRYERIAKELEEGKGTKMTLAEFNRWSQSLRKKHGKR